LTDVLLSHLHPVTFPLSARSAPDPEAAVVEHLATMIKLKFDSTIADAIIPKLRDTPEWLMKMMADITFRKMLIELHDQNRNSTLIKVALKEICKMGHHRCGISIAHLILIELITYPTARP
jgi:hypothetical protein